MRMSMTVTFPHDPSMLQSVTELPGENWEAFWKK